MNLVFIEGEEVVIRAPGCQPYRIEVSRLKTEREILGWVWHLTGKDWMSVGLVEQFVSVSLRNIGIEPDLYS